MGRHKIDYGIDLGTTNSAIARMESGIVKICKSDDTQMDTTPSCVYFNPKQTIFVGSKAFNQIDRDSQKAFDEFTKTGQISKLRNSFQEFKRSMGSDTKYYSSHMEREFIPEELSAEVLKKLKSYIRDEEVAAAVITIPMRFQQFQVDATRRAATLAGFQHIETLQEPIAASIAYGLESKKTQGYWFVFDLGGGTFDAALLRVVDGIMKVIDNAGDTRLGGRDIDYTIVDRIFIPYLSQSYNIKNILNNNQGMQLLRETLKRMSEEAKIRLSKDNTYNVVSDEPLGLDDDGVEMELDIKISLSNYKDIVGFIYQRAIDISNELLRKNNLTGTDLETVILVGGPTYSQVLRQMMREQLSSHIDSSVGPMTVVAQGAALYASTRDIPTILQKRDKTKIQLKLTYPETTVETEENLGIKIERSQTIGEVPQRVFVEVIRNDKGWSSGKVEIKEDAEIIQLFLNVGVANSFLITAFSETGTRYSCEPFEITIIQGLTVAKQIIPYDLCIETALPEKGRQRIIKINGLEKNQTLPAKGKSPTLKTQRDIRPGNVNDQIRIPIYGGDHCSRALYNNYAGTIFLTGQDFDKFLPKDSEVEITCFVDSTQVMRIEAYFPYIDETISKELEPNIQMKFDPVVIEREFSNVENKLSTLNEGTGSGGQEIRTDKLRIELDELRRIFEFGRGNDDEERKVEERLRDVWKELDRMEEENEIPKAKEKLNEAMNSLLINNQRYGNIETARIVQEFQEKTKLAMDETKNLRIIQEITDDVLGFEYWRILWEDPGFLVGSVKYYDDNFASKQWINSQSAKKLINEAKEMIASNFSKKELQNTLLRIFDLLPEWAKPYEERIDKDIFAYL
jgi:molecular chaperone DnaK